MNHYLLVRLLGSGGTSEVYLGVNKRSGKRCAIKKYQKGLAVRSVENELRLLGKLSHPLIPTYHESFFENGNWYVAMDYVPGITLKEKLEREGAMTETEVLRMGVELCDVISYLHTRYPEVLFRDIKPANLIVDPTGSIRLIDFGAAVEKVGDPVLPIGTPGYAAPEQFEKGAELDERTDIYGIGATMYHMLLGEKYKCQKEGQISIRSMNSKISKEMAIVVDTCLYYEREKRYQFCAEIKEELLRICKGTPRQSPRFLVLQSELLL